MRVFSGDSSLLEVILSGFRIPPSPSASLFSSISESQDRYDYILVVDILRGAMHTLFPQSGLQGKQICKKKMEKKKLVSDLFVWITVQFAS